MGTPRPLCIAEGSLSRAEAVLGVSIVLPNEFLQGDKISVDTIFFFLDAPVFSLPRHNLSRHLPSEFPADLLSARLVWVRAASSSPCTLSEMAPMLSSAGDPVPSPQSSC